MEDVIEEWGDIDITSDEILLLSLDLAQSSQEKSSNRKVKIAML